MVSASEELPDEVNVSSLGTPEYREVKNSVAWLAGHFGINPWRTHTRRERGWVGDSSFIFLETAGIKGLGSKPRMTVRKSMVETLDDLQANPKLKDGRA